MLRWLLSRQVRKALELARYVERLVNEQRDLLAPEAAERARAASRKLRQTAASGTPEQMREEMAQLEKTANEVLLPYPSPGMRDNIREMLVAVVVLFSFTTFFLQLTKIPTGSLQPTLFGITSQNLRERPDIPIPGPLHRFVLFWTQGIAHYEVIAREDGALREIEPPRLALPFVKTQRIRVGDQWHKIWFPPDKLQERAELEIGQTFRRGQPIIRMRVVSGDHLLVDRISYNFVRPKRGDLFVFGTRGVLEADQLYIKRLVALPNERVRIGDDQHLVINGERLDASTPRFENVYTFSPTPRPNHYFGHVNEKTANRLGLFYRAPLFRDGSVERQVGPHHFLAMGDNTLNSYDSRTWGDVPEQNVIGKCWFVYWPFTERFGWGNR